MTQTMLNLGFTNGTANSYQTQEIVMANKIKDTANAWESRAIGAEEEFVVAVDESHEHALDEALGMQAISIRLPKQLISQYKLIAHFHGVGYQPLMRDVLGRFVPNALAEILQEEKKKADQSRKDAPQIEHKKAA